MTCATILIAILDLFGRFLTAVLGAGFGATAAYLYAKHKQASEERQKNYGDAVAAFYVLVARYSAIENFCRKYLNEARDDFGDGLQLNLVYQHCPMEAVSLRPLAFMADLQDSDFIAELSLTDAKYFDFVDALKERNLDVRTVIRAAQAHGLRLDEPIGPSFPNYPEVDFAAAQNRNLVRSARSALNATLKELVEFPRVIHRRFPEHPTLSAVPIEIQEANKTSHATATSPSVEDAS